MAYMEEHSVQVDIGLIFDWLKLNAFRVFHLLD